ncbi:MAG: IS1634 family transposase [Deltaproteobacteria bacterium]|nr:IS1634 family transposase [Deltaproteobacteria bacterium]
MYVDVSKSQGKYTRYLLRESYREKGKVKHRTIANLSRCSEEEIEAIRLALSHKKDLAALGTIGDDICLRQGLSVGAVWLVYDMARQLGVTNALGCSRQGKLALWQVIARVINQGSRLSSVRLAGSHAGCDILGLTAFDEDDLYKNLDWLCEKQSLIEDRLFKKTHPDKHPGLFLYDVTSSYLEGTHNELAAFGYNRDGKKGKRQIVIGLLCNEEGKPLSIEVFSGNTQDPKTLASQIRKVAKRFGGSEVTFVGDRGMIKTHQVEDLLEHGFHYITAITKPQIESLLAKGVIQMSLFDQELAEVVNDDGIRYVLRRNPIRAQEIRESRQSKYASLTKEVKKQNEYLTEHLRAHVEVALRKIDERCKKIKLSKWVTPSASGRHINLAIDKQAQEQESKLDGCYVLKTDLRKETANKETVHARYKDLALVEWAFRTSKTVELEMRPIYVRLADRTRGHAFIVMLAYRIVGELAQRWHDIELTVEEGIKELATLCATEMLINGRARCNQIPQPRSMVSQLLKAARVQLPDALPCSGIRVATRKKLVKQRKRR